MPNGVPICTGFKETFCETALVNSSTVSCPVQTVSGGSDWLYEDYDESLVENASFGSQHSAVIKTDGTLWMWGLSRVSAGKDDAGSLLAIDANITRISSPVQTISQGTNWKQVSLGDCHSASIKTDGTLWLWGYGPLGRLGNNSILSVSSPVQTVSQGTNWKQVSSGFGHTAAIKTDGTLWLWGSDIAGELGNNLDTSGGSGSGFSSPVQTISQGTNWKQVSLGRCFSSAIKTDGTLWLWGLALQGRLGNNSTTDRSSPVQTISTGTNWKSVSLGSGHSAGIKNDGTLWLWGGNTRGQLGSGVVTSYSSPVQTVSQGTNWKQVSLGEDNTSAIKTDGTLWLWGDGSNGELGNNSTINRSSPVQTVSTGTNWKNVFLGANRSGSVKTDGTLWVWGCGGNGVLGNYSTIARSSPVQTVSQTTEWASTEECAWCSFSSSTCHSVAIKTDGTLWLWGSSSFGELGDNSTANKSSPVQTVSQGTNWKQVSAGSLKTGSIKTDGTLWMWGRGICGGLGNNSSVNHSSPVQTVSQGTNWKQVMVGRCHSGAIKTDGTLWMWGDATCGALGNNSTVPRSSPVQTVSTGTNWKQVSFGSYISSAIKTDGTLWTWGLGANGALGNNSIVDQSSPVQTISQGNNWKQVSMGWRHSAAIKTDGTLWLWGIDSSGQLGNDSTINRSSPVQTVSTGTNWKQVSLGDTHSSSVKTDGTLWLWGGGGDYRLGNNSTIARSSPVQTVSQGTNWKQVSLGINHSSALDNNNQLCLWGLNTSGQIGRDGFEFQCRSITTDLGNMLVEKEYLLDVYPNIVPNMKTPELYTWGDSSHGESMDVNCIASVVCVPRPTSYPLNWKVISMGGLHGVGIKTDGTLWTWGSNYCGELGNNSTSGFGYYTASPVQTVSAGTNWGSVAARLNASASIKTDGTLWLWGIGTSGRLGNNSTTNRSSPVQTVSTGTNWKQVALGGVHAAAIKTDGTLWLWGSEGGAGNQQGSLGNNSILINRSSPVQTVSQGTNWKQVSLGNTGSAAIKTDGTLWLWGPTASLLGNNSSVQQSSPVQTISQGTSWKQVSISSTHTAAIKTDGTLWVWGSNVNGQFGDLNTISYSSPVQTISQGTNWKCIQAGASQSFGLKTDGTLWTWGCNSCGKLGTGNTLNVSSPVQTITSGSNWKSFSAPNSYAGGSIAAINEGCGW